MTRPELYNGKWHIVKRHATTHKIVAISEKSYKSRGYAKNAYNAQRIGYLENNMQFLRV
jgi:hypothetical protein